MNTRIKDLRKTLDLTQEEFSQKIGVSRASLSNIEAGRINITERVRRDICRTFNVNSEWLLEGTGSMFLDSCRDLDITRFCGRLLASENEEVKNIFAAFAKMPMEFWEALNNEIKIQQKERE